MEEAEAGCVFTVELRPLSSVVALNADAGRLVAMADLGSVSTLNGRRGAPGGAADRDGHVHAGRPGSAGECQVWRVFKVTSDAGEEGNLPICETDGGGGSELN